MDEATAAVAAALGHTFSDPGLIVAALTHRSRPAEDPVETSNERLEFLGDAVLGLVVATTLHDRWDLVEGEMSKVRAAVVDEATLAGMARTLGVGQALRLGRGEENSGGRDKSPILADAMEALIGAVYVDAGLAAAEQVVLRHWGDLIERRAATPGDRDHKTQLQEMLARRGSVPEYTVEASGPDHARSFRAAVSAGGRVLGRGTGTSKKRAEQAAARRALAGLGEHDA